MRGDSRSQVSTDAPRARRAARFGGCAVDHQLVLGRLLERQIAGFFAPQNAIDVTGRAAEPLRAIRPVERQAAQLHEERLRIDRRYTAPGDEADNVVA
jgi:hypothetical protein